MRPTYIVDALEENDSADAWLAKDIPIKSSERADSRTIVENPISSNTLIQDGDLHTSRGDGKTLRQLIGPILVGPLLCSNPIGDRVSERE